MRALAQFTGCVLAVQTFLTAAAPAAAQSADSPRGPLPAAVAEQVLLRLNDPATPPREGDTRIGSSSHLMSDVVVLDGELTIAGGVHGRVLVVNGNVVFLPGAMVEGDILVIGGTVVDPSGAAIGQEIVTYPDRFGYERVDGQIRQLARPRGSIEPRDRGGTADFTVATGKSYNRVEGLPVAFGPRITMGGSNPFRLEALAIYRSESGMTLDPAKMGYFVRAEQALGGREEYRFGGTLHSLIDPIEEWQITDLESGLATFLLHRDYRDHYQRQGGSLFTEWEPAGAPLLVHFEARWEKHGIRGAGSPWSLLDNADEWRPQPVAAEGSLGSFVIQADYDTSSPSWNPASGWSVRGSLEQAFRTDLRQPPMAAPDPLSGAGIDAALEYDPFLTGLIDIRRYNRVNADARLNLRVVAGGSLTGEPLPSQRQHALGGEGSLPGYALFSADCQARQARVLLPEHRSPESAVFFPQYGCDAFGLLQAEYRGKLGFRFRWDVAPGQDDRDGAERVRDFGWDMAPDWSIFVDAGRGWTFHDRPDEPTLVNVGAGILLERLGVYLALPVTGGKEANLFVRLGPRF